MLDDTSAYYLLGYTSTEAPRDGKFHEIQVRVKRKDVEVRARKGYWAYTDDEVEHAAASPKPGPPRDVQDALDGLATPPDRRNGIPFGIWVGAGRGADGKAHGDARVGSRAPAASADDPSTVDHVAVLATTASGEKMFAGTVAKRSRTPPRGRRARVTFEAPPGRLRVQVCPPSRRRACAWTPTTATSRCPTSRRRP